MLVKVGLALLVLWAMGMLLLETGSAFHLVLLVGLMALLIGGLKARDDAIRADAAERPRSEGQ